MIIFGIDPGTATTGYGVIKHSKNQKSKIKNGIELIDYGCIVTPKDKEMPLRLYSIQKSVMKYLGKRRLKKPLNGYLDDAADALAVAICHVIKIGKNSKGI